MITCAWQWPATVSTGETFNLCGCPDHPSYRETVTDDCCRDCPLRVDAKDLRPRSRKLWPTCPNRRKESRTEPCGCKYEVARCVNPESEHFQQEVRPKDCRACPLIASEA